MFGIDKSVVSTSHTKDAESDSFFNIQYVIVFGLKTFRTLSVSFLCLKEYDPITIKLLR